MGVNFFWKSLVAPCDKASQGTDVFSGRDNLLHFCICLGDLSGFLGKDRGQEISVERKETEKENIIYYKGRALVTGLGRNGNGNICLLNWVEADSVLFLHLWLSPWFGFFFQR